MEAINTDLNYFNKKGERKIIKNALFLNNFLFSKSEFFLVDVGDRYNICVSRDSELYAIWAKMKKDATAHEAISIFRKEYVKNNITLEKIEGFLKKPKKIGKVFSIES